MGPLFTRVSQTLEANHHDIGRAQLSHNDIHCYFRHVIYKHGCYLVGYRDDMPPPPPGLAVCGAWAGGGGGGAEYLMSNPTYLFAFYGHFLLDLFRTTCSHSLAVLGILSMYSI